MNELVLIVEDEKDTVELLRYNLQKEGYRIVTAQDGEEAIIALQTHNPDIMLLDIMLPVLSGWEVCNALRSKGVTIPVVMLTALSAEEEHIKGLNLGADDYILKPFSVKELMLRVKKLLEKEKAIKILEIKEKEGADSLRYLIHELRNSVQIVGGFSGLAMKKYSSDRYLSDIKSSAGYMESILNDASLLTRLEKGEKLSPITVVDIREQLAWAVNAVRNEALSKEIDIHLHLLLLSDSSRMVKGNITAVRQVLINLLSNAVKYNRRQGKIWVYTKESDECIEVHIKDTGYGISEEETLRVFEKFYRAKGSESTKGTGLGLYLVKLLMDAMGGNITAQRREGIGSIFSISFKKESGLNLSS